MNIERIEFVNELGKVVFAVSCESGQFCSLTKFYFNIQRGFSSHKKRYDFDTCTQ